MGTFVDLAVVADHSMVEKGSEIFVTAVVDHRLCMVEEGLGIFVVVGVVVAADQSLVEKGS